MALDGSARDPDTGQGAAEGAPSLVLNGYTGPLDRLLALARAHQVDLAQLSLLDLIDQLATAMDRASLSVPLGQRAGWLVLAAWLLQLRSRLLVPMDPPAKEAADTEAGRLRDRWAELQSVQALATWLTAKPQLGCDMFARGQPGWHGSVDGAEHQVDVIEFLWAAIVLFDADLPTVETAPVYRPAWLDLHSVPDARERIRRMLSDAPDGYTLGQLRPQPQDGPPPDGPAPGELKQRSAWSSTFVACLELAKQGEIGLEQEKAFASIRVQQGIGA